MNSETHPSNSGNNPVAGSCMPVVALPAWQKPSLDEAESFATENAPTPGTFASDGSTAYSS